MARKSFSLFGGRVTTADRAFISRQLATMLASGLPIDRSIAVLANQFTNPFLIDVFHQIETDLEAGLSFSSALAKHPRVFNRVFVNVVMAGEAVGKVADVLGELADRAEQDQEFISKIQGALYYPAFVFVAMIIIAIILMIKVIPEFRSVFDQAGVALPWVTNVLITISTFMAQRWYVVLLGLVIIVVGVRAYLSTQRGKQFLDYLAVYFPTGILRYLYMSRFTRTLALLVQSGTPIIEALSITADVVNNGLYANIILRAKDDVARGIPLSTPLSKSPLFPVIVPQMILVGEQTGRLDQVLTSLADYFEAETSARVKAVSSLFEPVVIVIVGLGVAFIVFAIFLPIYGLARFS